MLKLDLLDTFIKLAKENISEGYYKIKEYKTKKNSLKNVLNSQKFSLITEIKHASPAGEYSFDNIDVEKTAHLFKESGADAISVVVEPKIFKGNLRNIALAKQAGLPVLLKDFIICEEQIIGAKNSGADTVLLIVKLIDRLKLDLDELIRIAHKNKLEVLLESYDKEELKTAVESNADILGINNRDLQTLKVDINRTKQILDEFDIIKINKPIISESGVRTKEDVEFIRKSGVNGILVGTAIWKTQNIKEKIKELKT